MRWNRGVLYLSLVLLVGAVAAREALAADPQRVGSTLEGCRNNGDITLPNGDGDFICPDDAYTTGNLGKGWNELDLVPYRITLSAGNSAPSVQTYTIAVALDAIDVAVPGYDVISGPVLNTELSDASCLPAVVGAESILAPGIGGIDVTRYRLVTITQNKNTDCVYDYFGRLALGSHLFSGSSLHANLLNEHLGTAGIGAADVSIPVKEILPQELSKTMSATQDAEHVWNVTKSASPVSLDFENTCDEDADAREDSVEVTVTWTKLPASPAGDITVITNISAKNPASRVITVSVSDAIRSGTTVLDTASSGAVDVPANTQMVVFTHTFTVPEGTADLNDIATATYTDKVTGVPVPGTTSATASAEVQPSGTVENFTETITATESITGSFLEYAVDSFTGASGAYDGGYLAGAFTTASVTWTSDEQSDSGSVTFDKRVRVTQPAITSGTLSDTAELTTSGGVTSNANASVALSASATVALTIDKTIPAGIITGAETATFDFVVDGPTDTGAQIIFSDGETSDSAVVGDLEPGSYTVSETANPPWSAQSNQVANLELPTCSAEVSFDNDLERASARVKKVSDPAGFEAGWQFTLTGPNTSESVTTTGTGFVAFAAVLAEGHYTITETAQTGFTNLGGSAECEFDVNYPADAGREYSCTFTNRLQPASARVQKITQPAGFESGWVFTMVGPGTPPGGELVTTTGAGYIAFTTVLQEGTYAVSELQRPDFQLIAPATNLCSFTIDYPADANRVVSCDFTNRRLGIARLVKTVGGAQPPAGSSFAFELRTGASAGVAGFVVEPRTTDALGGIDYLTLLIPGTVYQLCEVGLPAGWTSSLLNDPSVFYPDPLDNSTFCVPFSVLAGETRIFAIDNTPPPGGDARTIGYWKNHSSCSKSNGKQSFVLDQTLAAFPGGGVLIGDIFVDTCREAYAILDKSDLNGTKRASDAAYGLAAQLLAAKLSIQATAGTCPAVLTAIAQGQALLDAANFIATGTYKNKIGATANSVAATLDAYNNNNLCP